LYERYFAGNPKYFSKRRQELLANKTITAEQYAALIQDKCIYCGKEPAPYNGLDRVDSSKGYTPENTVACCTRCNYAKNDFSIEEFRQWLLKIIEFHSP